MLEALRRYAQNPGAARVVAAATTQEEIAWHGGGALVCTNCINPQMAIVVDVTFATDHPNIEKKEIGDHKIGGGPVLSRGALISPVVFEMLRDTAERQGDQVLACTRPGATRRRTPTRFTSRAKASRPALVSVPNRYMHSPNEMVSLDDVDKTCDAASPTSAARSSAKTDFTARVNAT